VVVFAAGNENRDIDDAQGRSVNGFAIHPNVIAVAASTSRDERSDYSNFGKAISVCAPSDGAGGHGVLTTDVTGDRGYNQTDYAYDFGGTSSACPLVAGIAALVLTVAPSLRAEEVKDLLQRTARRIGVASDFDANGHSKQFGFGVVNAVDAVKNAVRLAPARLVSKAPRPAKAKKPKRTSVAALTADERPSRG
jgi:subtilisin family serine protease